RASAPQQTKGHRSNGLAATINNFNVPDGCLIESGTHWRDTAHDRDQYRVRGKWPHASVECCRQCNKQNRSHTFKMARSHTAALFAPETICIARKAVISGN